MRHHITDPAEAIFACLGLMQHLLTILRSGAFRCHHQRTQAARRVPPFDEFCQFVVVERNLRNQNCIRATSDAAVERDPSGVAPHHFQHHDSFVTRRRRMQAIERIGHGRDRGIETEGHGRRLQIVVDRFWHSDAIDASILELLRGRHRAVAARQ